MKPFVPFVVPKRSAGTADRQGKFVGGRAPGRRGRADPAGHLKVGRMLLGRIDN